jgi:hypothetical protein
MLLQHGGAALGVEPRRLQLRVGLAQLRTQHADARFGAGEVGLAGEALLRQAFRAGKDAQRLLMIGRDHADRRLGGGHARLRQRHVLLGQHAVEPRHHLAGLHHHAFLDQHLDHLAGDLGRDGGLTPRHHVARCREAAGAARFGSGRLRCRRGLCGRLLRRGLSDAGHEGLQSGHEETDGRHHHEDESKPGDQCRPTASTRRWRRNGARAPVDCQAAQQFGLVFGHSRHPVLVRADSAMSADELKQLRDTRRCRRDGL